MSVNNTRGMTIVHFGVGHGDCTLIIIKDRAKHTDPLVPDEDVQIAILIDTGPARAFAGNRTAVALWTAIEERLTAAGHDRLDYFIVSHLDADHTGLNHQLLEYLCKAYTINKQRFAWIYDMEIIDRTTSPPTTKQMPPVYRNFARPRDLDFEVFNRFKTELLRGKTPRAMEVGLDILPAKFEGKELELQYSQMVCVAAYGTIETAIGEKPLGQNRLSLEGAASPESGLVGETIYPRSENDLSFAFLVRFSNFYYFTAGDLGGRGALNAKNKRNENQSDVETPLSAGMKERWAKRYSAPNDPVFRVNLFKVSHHGSNDSTEKAFIDNIAPEAAVFTVGPNYDKHPTEGVMNRLRDKRVQQFFTLRVQGLDDLSIYPDGRLNIVQLLKDLTPVNVEFARRQSETKIPKEVYPYDVVVSVERSGEPIRWISVSRRRRDPINFQKPGTDEEPVQIRLPAGPALPWPTRT